MKKFIFILCFLSSLNMVSNAQDLIITTEGDTLNCKITKQKGNYVYFIFKHENETRNTLLSIEQINKLKKNYFSKPEVSASIYAANMKSDNSYCFFIDAGGGFRSADIYETGSEDVDDFLKKLKNGFHLSLGAIRYWGEYFGAGVEYSLFKASHSMNDIHASGGVIGKTKNNTSIHYVGPSFNMRFASHRNLNAFVISMGIGYLGYKDKLDMDGQSITFTGGNIGYTTSIGYDIALSEKAALGFKLSIVSGSLSKMKFSLGPQQETLELEGDERENLSRINISVGLRFMGKQ